MSTRIELSFPVIRMRNLTTLIKVFVLFCSCLLSSVQSLQDNPFLTKDFANLFTTPSPTTSTTTQSSSTATFPPPFNLPFQFSAPSSSSSSSSPSSSSSFSSSNPQSGSGINWNYPSIFKYQSTNDKRQETSSSTSSNNYNSNFQKPRPVVNYGKAPIELYTLMSMKKGRYFPPPEDNDGYSGLVPKSGSNVIGPNGLMQPGMDPSMGSGFAAMQGLDASPSMGYDMGHSFPSQSGMNGYPSQTMALPSMGIPNMGMGYAPQQGLAGLGMMPPQANSPFGSAAGYGMGSPYGVPSPMAMPSMAMPYANPPSYFGYPNLQPAASSIYSAYSGYSPAPAYPGFGYGIGGYGSGMYPMSGGLLGAASHTMGSILSPFAALAQSRYPYSLFPFG